MRRAQNSQAAAIVAVLFLFFDVNTALAQEVNSSNEHLRLNQLQYIGTHNSFHVEPEQGISLLLSRQNLAEGRSQEIQSMLGALRYTHQSLSAQLSLGVRKFELDILYDPTGNRFANPAIHRMLKSAGIPLHYPYDTDGELIRPGFKIIHIPDLDVRSTCLSLQACLSQIKAWSDKHEGHFPIVIQLEAKHQSTPALDPDFATAEVLPLVDVDRHSIESRRIFYRIPQACKS